MTPDRDKPACCQIGLLASFHCNSLYADSTQGKYIADIATCLSSTLAFAVAWDVYEFQLELEVTVDLVN